LWRRAIESSEVRASEALADTLSRIEYYYDSSTVSGNLTNQTSWDSYEGGVPRALTRPLIATNSISVVNQYDVNGNRILSTDARGQQTQYVFGTINGFSGLYVTQIKEALATSVQRTISIEYDFYTGLVTRTTDADNGVSSTISYDAFGRPILGKDNQGTPKESQTSSTYSDVSRRIIVRTDLNTTGDAKRVVIHHYDQIGRLRLSRSLEDSATQTPEDETLGIKTQTRYAISGQNSYTIVSNPYRAATSIAAAAEPTMGWSRTKFDKGGRPIETQYYNGAALPAPLGSNTASSGTDGTTYDGIYTTVTDAAGKSRRSMVDGLGRLVRLDEPDSSGLGTNELPVQPTYYAYNALGNVTQAS